MIFFPLERILDERDYSHLAFAARALERIDLVHPLY